jgi:tRNA (guanine37-N1)-methyltransferase
MKAARNGGTVHYYAIAPEESLYRDTDLIKKASEQLGFSVDVIHMGIVRSYAPKRYNVVIEFRVRKPANQVH